MSQNNLFVSYFVAQPTKGKRRPDLSRILSNENDGLMAYQKNLVNDYLAQNGGTLVESFIDLPENRRTQKWPQLSKALDSCRATGASLLVSELGNLIGNESFSETLLNSGIPFVCCDQPFVDRNILEILSKHAQILRKQHGKLIREGLKMTSAKSGNPNAAQVISKVNKPKIDTAIVFAFLIQSIINDYKRKGFSQRHMVKTLNDEGFTAPEGGRWVLSQLQKVLDRVRLNELAVEHQTLIQELRNTTPEITLQQICDVFNQRNFISIKRSSWDEEQMRKLIERIEQIQDIARINQFALFLVPIVHEYRQQGLNETAILADLQQKGFVLKQAQLSGKTIALHHGENTNVSNLKQLLLSFPAQNQSLDSNLESAAKHIPAYLKIVKGHISQLEHILNTENHNRRGLENTPLAETVQQLVALFNILQEEDIASLENMAFEASEWMEDEETAARIATSTAGAAI